MLLKGKRNIINLILSLPKTIYFNFKVFSFKQAICLPILVSSNTVIRKAVRNSIVLTDWDKKHYRVTFGFGGSGNISSNPNSYICIQAKNSLIFKGEAHFASGCSIAIWSGGSIEFGDNFSANKNCIFESDKRIVLGNDVLLGWNIIIRDSDGRNHTIYYQGNSKENKKPIQIGNHVWIGSYVDILKGVNIGDDSVIAWRSMVNKSFNETGVLIGGIPAKKITNNIEWKG